MNLATRLGDGYLGDIYINSFLHSRDIYCVFPKVSKVRNWGHDGSGINCGKASTKFGKLFTNQVIDSNNLACFDDDIDIIENSFINKRIYSYMKPSIKGLIKRLMCFVLLRTYAKIK